MLFDIKKDPDPAKHIACAGIIEATKMVHTFHTENRIADVIRIDEVLAGNGITEDIEFVAAQMSSCAEKMQEHVNDPTDPRGLRAHLEIEELTEFISAMYHGDEVGMLDALADRLYVLLGTAVQFDLPIWQAFVEVHMSNMTKKRQAHDPFGGRVRDKGPDYVPPDIVGVLQQYRAEQEARGV